MDLDGILAVGDIQYEDGQLWKFMRSFDPTWGRLKPLMRPVPGNHEYRIAGASGYFDYFNGPGRFTGQAGDRDKGYYSFDVGSWHVVALNSQCDRVGGCGPSSPQVQWLRADLAANPAACTLAFWHHPRFTSGEHDDGGDDVLPLWNVLYGANADLIVNGHEHFYERFGPQNPSGAADPARGIRQVIVGTGGRSHHGFIDEKPNSQVQDSDTLGVFTLALAEGEYRWELRRAVTGGRVDTGSAACH
jgi:acid phosphatase type 7